MIKFSLLGETILEWNDKDIEHHHDRRMAMDRMLCRFKRTYSAERIDSVRSLLEDKERQMFQIVRLMDEQQSIIGRVRHDSVKRLIIPVAGIRQRIAAADVELLVVDVMKEHVDATEVVGRDVDLLAEESLLHVVLAQYLGEL